MTRSIPLLSHAASRLLWAAPAAGLLCGPVAARAEDIPFREAFGDRVQVLDDFVRIRRDDGVADRMQGHTGALLLPFGYLWTLPVDYLKIDGSFVRNIATDPNERLMAETINRVGHVMGLQTVGEFAKSAELISELNALGVDFAQGYGVQRPQPLPLALSELTAPA